MKQLVRLIAYVCFFSFSSFAQQVPPVVVSHPTPTGWSTPNINFSRVNLIEIDPYNRLWVGGAYKGIAVHDSITNTWQTLDSLGGLISDSVTTFAFQGGEAWIGTRNGLVRYANITSPPSAWNQVASYGFFPLPNKVVTDVFLEAGFAWIGTQTGLARLNLSSNAWNYYLASDSITKIMRDATGSLWVGSRNGLFKTDNNGSSWTSYTQASTGSVIGRHIYDLEYDASSRLWISSGSNYFSSNSPSQLTCKISYLQNGVFKEFNANQFAYGHTSFVPIGSNITFVKDHQGYILFTCPANGIFAGNSNLTNANYVIFRVGSTSTCDISLLPMSACSVSTSSSLGLACKIIPNGQLWRLNRLRGFCSETFDYSPYLTNLVSLSVTDPPTSLGNPVGSCNQPVGQGEFDVNLVRTTILGGGDMHWNLDNGKYEVPKGSGKHAIFTSAHWIGGLDSGGQVRVAAQTYRQTGVDYWAGPIDGISPSIGSNSCEYFDKVYDVSRWEIEQFKNNWNAGTVNYQPCNNNVPLGILNWPAKDGNYIVGDLAPFVDVDGNGVYNPLTGGDYPQITGDQTVFKVYNDIGNIHTETGSDQLGFEFQTSTYGYLCDGIFPVFKVLNYTTLYKTKIINKSNTNYTNMYFGWWVDADLGNYIDDYVGCNVGRNTGYAYNGDADDEGGSGYGLNPPIINVKVLRGPMAPPGDGLDNNNNGTIDEAGEYYGMNKFVYYNNDNSPLGNPSGFSDFYNYLRGVWRDNQPITYGADGRDPSAPVCNFMFPGTTDPLNFPTLGEWSEFTAGNVPADRRFIMSSGPFNFNAGDTVEFDYAYIFTRDSLSGGPTNFTLNNTNLDLVQYWFDNNNFPGCTVYSVGQEEANQTGPGLLVYPNPSSDLLKVSVGYNGPAGMRYEIFNAMGKLVQQGEMTSSEINIKQLPPQVYFFRLHGTTHSWITRFVKQ